MNHHDGTPAEKLMRKKTIKEVKEVLEKYSILYTDWGLTDNGMLKKIVDRNKKNLLLVALLESTLLVEESLKK